VTEDAKASRAALEDWGRALQYRKQIEISGHTTLLSALGELADTKGNNLALIGEGGALTYRALVDLSHRYARWGLEQGLEPGATVCLVMPNCPDYVAIWLGISQIGCAVALINTNLAGDALAHCIRLADARHIIVASSLLARVTAISAKLPDGMDIWLHGDSDDIRYPRIDVDVATGSCDPSDTPRARLPKAHDRALLINTSGTTGLPKAAYVSHARILEWSYWFAGLMDARPEDRLYNCLPMYHSVGGVVAIGSMLTQGASIVIRTRFSASRFWDDIVDERCTVFQYIGELCRYLLQTPQHPREGSHKLRLCCGNGLQGEVWERFQARFAVPRILEFYAATEGNVSLYNCEGKPGAIGRIPSFLRHSFPVALVKIDVETGEPLRDEAGFCLRCAADEPGEALGKLLSDSSSPARRFDGYTDESASARKVLRDVFAPGDRWFRTGDMMRKDEAGFFYFVDRLGDTFRWKGENVSTTEVAAVIGSCRGVTDAVVYGVAIPGVEGRVGMAAIAADKRFNLEALRTHMHASLPDYARPLFVRLTDGIEITGTFKTTKGSLTREGLSNASPESAVWFDDRASQAFVKCDPPLLRKICDGELRL
jgi:fatty-acyl-CoA synthase